MKKELYENLPLFEIVIDENDDATGLRYLSIVKKPAIQIKGFAFADKKFDLQPNDEMSKWFCHLNCNCSFNAGVWTTEPTPDGKFPCKICIDMKEKYETWYRRRGTGSSSAPGSRRFSEQEFQFEIIADKQIIAGPAMIPDLKIYREDEDGNGFYVKFSNSTIKKLVDKFIKADNNRSINLEHSDTMVPAYIQEQWIVENSTYDKSKYYGFNLPVGSWFVVVKIEDADFWMTDIKEQKRFGFSIEGILGTKLVQMADVVEAVFDNYYQALNDFFLKNVNKLPASFKNEAVEIIDTMTIEDFMEIAKTKIK